MQELGTVILGASFDSIEENRKFAQEQGFKYQLLSDSEKEVGPLYQVMREPGDKFESLPKRISYLIDPEGIIQVAYEVSDPQSHAQQVIEDLKRLTSG